MGPAFYLIGMTAIIIIIASFIKAKNKGNVKCNRCGVVGPLKPKYTNIQVLGGQKLVCANCGSEDYTEMRVIQKQNEQRDQQKSMIDLGHVCPTCMRAVEPGVRFCPYDGTPVSKTCSKCGQANAPASAFCGGCGTKL